VIVSENKRYNYFNYSFVRVELTVMGDDVR